MGPFARLFLFLKMATERLAETIERIEALLQPLLAAEGFELVELDLNRGPQRHLLRLTIDRAGRTRYFGSAKEAREHGTEDDSVGITDCTRVSKLISPLLDVEDLIPTAYTLEVSSPGVNRPLQTEHHFKVAQGLMVRIKTRAPVAGESFFIAKLIEASDEGVALDVRGNRVEIPYRLIQKANVEYQF